MSAAPSATEQSKRGKKPAPSGRLLLRMPAALHAELARTAEREGVSLNQFITRALAGKIGWGTDADDGAPAAPSDNRRLIAIALVANAIVIGLAALAAIAVLVLAWQRLEDQRLRKDLVAGEALEPVRGEVERRLFPEQLRRDGVPDGR